MAKTLVVAEKPSVARDLASTLPGSFKGSKDKTHLEGEDYLVTWAVGHLGGRAPPDEYDRKLKKGRFADLPILPDEFKLIPNDERAGKQLRAIHRLMADDEVESIVNACDAGREGELIFAYVYDLAPVQKPVQRLWLSSMTKTAIKEAFGRLRPGEELQSLEEAARLRSEAEAQAIVDAVTGQAGEITKLEKSEQREQPQLLYDLTSLQRHANSLYGFSARRTLAAAQRLYEEHKALTYPRTNSRFLTGDMVAELKPT